MKRGGSDRSTGAKRPRRVARKKAAAKVTLASLSAQIKELRFILDGHLAAHNVERIRKEALCWLADRPGDWL